MDADTAAEALWPSAESSSAQPPASTPATPAASQEVAKPTTPPAAAAPAKSLEERMWPGQAEPEPVKRAEPSKAEKREIAQTAKLYPEAKPLPVANNVPEAIKAMREADVSRKLFDVTATYADSINAESFERAAHVISKDDLPEVAHVAADLGLDAISTSEIVRLAQSPVPDAKTELQWREDALEKLLLDNNGNLEAAKKDIALARSLMTRDPRVLKTMNALGIAYLGNHSRVFELVLNAARAEKMAGRLK